MKDGDDFWKVSITFVVLIFAVYPMIKDYYNDPITTISVTVYAIIYAFLIMVIIFGYQYLISKKNSQ